MRANPLRALPTDRRGAVSIYFAMTVTAIVLLMLAALDLMRVGLLRFRTQSALDAAVLAAGRNLAGGTAQWQADATAYFNANMGNGSLNATVTEPVYSDPVPLPNGAEITMSVKLTVPLMITAFTTAGAMEFDLLTRARQRTRSDVEMVLAIDNSGSMAQNVDSGSGSGRYHWWWSRFGSSGSSTTKMDAAADAATTVVNTMLGPTSGGNVSVGLVPFTETVRVGNTALTRGWLDQSNPPFNISSNWKGCLKERPNSSGQYYFDKRSPSEARFRPYTDTLSVLEVDLQVLSLALRLLLGPNISLYQQNGCVTAPVQFLNTDATTLTTSIQAMDAGGSTMLASGLLWSWRMLSPSWRGTTNWGSATLPADAQPGLTKVAVLLTDGDNHVASEALLDLDILGLGLGVLYRFYSPYGNARHVNPWGNLTGANNIHADNLVWNNLSPTDVSGYASLCHAMKADDIVIYTIAFGDSVSANTQTILRECASDRSKFMVAPKAADLQEAFGTIMDSLSELTIIQ